jgi:hypothetical protein
VKLQEEGKVCVIIKYFIYPTDAKLDCSKNVKICIKIYMRVAPACFGFSKPSSGSYNMCFALQNTYCG